MQYNIGMYGGSFDPLHVGHLNSIIEAAAQCKTLYVVLSYSRTRDHVPMEIRYRWLVASFRHLDNVRIILLEDDAPSKAAYDEDAWQLGRDKVLEQIGQAVDVVFCGSDYQSTNRYERLYGCPVYYFDREQMRVSSSQLRENPLRHWPWLANCCKPYYAKKVLFVGGESTGKSTIVRNLALVYGTNYLEEVGREVCLKAGKEETMVEADFHEILLRHKVKEMDCLKQSNRILFEDTDAMTTLWYAHFLLTKPEEIARTTALAEAIGELNRFDLIFFLEPTVPFIQDGTRNEAINANRTLYSNQIKAVLEAHGMSYISLDGSYADRFCRAKQIINDTFQITEI